MTSKDRKRISTILANMKSRCSNPNDTNYPNYGGRGITVCQEWLAKDGLNKFYTWALANGYASNLSIDRVDNNGNYEPENCRWATQKEQSNNRRDNKIVEAFGVVGTYASIIEKFSKFPRGTVDNRLASGWDLEKALIHPKVKANKRANRIFTELDGKSVPLKETVDMISEVSYSTVIKRLSKGKSFSEAISQPSLKQKMTAFGLTASIAELVREFGKVKRTTVLYRLGKGWSLEEALTTENQNRGIR